MANFARIDENNIVDLVIFVSNDDIVDENGNETEEAGIAFCNSVIEGNWVQTSYNANMRKNFAGIGYLYNSELDAFIPPQNFPSWVLDEERCVWVSPVPMPTEGRWSWDEDSTSWVEIQEPLG